MQYRSFHQIFYDILSQVNPIDFRLACKLEESNSKLMGKHFIVATVEELLNVAKSMNLQICKKDAFIYVFNGQYWVQVPEAYFCSFLGEAALKMGIESVEAKFYLFKDQLYKQFMASANLEVKEVDKSKVLINLQNGTFEYTRENGGFLREFSAEDFLTYQLPFEYDPNAEAPLFDAFLKRVLPYDEIQDVVSEFLGYVFAKDLKLEKCLLLYGGGANGKSVLFDIVNALFGRVNVTTFSLNHLSEEHNRALIVNKLLNYGSEINSRIEADTFKQMVSGEPMQCRLKYGNTFISDDYARLMFNCNQLPKEVEHTEAYFRRFLIVPFLTTIPVEERNPDLARTIIKTELAGIFNWVLSGLNRIVTNRCFTESPIVMETIQGFKKQSDSVIQFLDEYEYVKSYDSFVEEAPLFKSYQYFCKENGMYPLGRLNFGMRLERMDFHRDRNRNGKTVFLKTSRKNISFIEVTQEAYPAPF